MIIKQQDRKLDTVINSIGVLKETASTIGQELQDQAVFVRKNASAIFWFDFCFFSLVEEVDTHMDRFSNRLGRAMKKTVQVIRDSKGTRTTSVSQEEDLSVCRRTVDMLYYMPICGACNSFNSGCCNVRKRHKLIYALLPA